jgi:transposase
MEMGDMSDFERGQIVDARLAGASVTRTNTLLGVSIVTICKVMSAYTYHGKIISARTNSGRNSTLTDRDRRTLKRAVLKKIRELQHS